MVSASGSTQREEDSEAVQAEAIAQLVRGSAATVVVVDDDPGGTQTLHGVQVLTEWSVEALAAALASAPACFCVLTNSRSLPAATAGAIAREVAANLAVASRQTGRSYTVISRSDSTLRGHFWPEVTGLRQGRPESYDAVIFVPAFFEADRVTIEDVHYVRHGGALSPVADTEFARDVTFGFRESNLRDWLVARSGGTLSPAAIVSIALALLRGSSAATQVRDQLLAVPGGAFVIVNAETYADLAAFVHGVLLAEACGRRFLFRAAPSFIRLRAAMPNAPLLTATDVRGASGRGGLVIVGSYTAKTTEQLHLALQRPRTTGVEFQVQRIARDDTRSAELERVAMETKRALDRGATCLLYTSRDVATAIGRAGDLSVARHVSSTLVDVVKRIHAAPSFVVAKGGITASDVATKGFDMRQAWVLGQILTGIPVWKLGAESRFPGMPLVVFPGNFGTPQTLCDLLDRLEDNPS
jgi:uncharacterized protein YgbK (DUF1537 family)